MIDTQIKIFHRFFPGKPSSGRNIPEILFGRTGTVYNRDEIVYHYEIPLLIPVYYKAYIIRRITSGETNGQAGDKNLRAGPAGNLRNHGGGIIIRINSFGPHSIGSAGGSPALTARKNFRKFSGGTA
jgi:hypothetical protein